MSSHDSWSETARQQAAINLRPLTLGEILDRAFTIYFKHLAAFSALLAVVLVPSTLISYFQSRDMIDFFITTIQHQIQSPTSTPDLAKLNALQPSNAWIGLQYAFIFVGLPFAYAAVVAGVSKAYAGLPVRFSDAYRFALVRWLPILILLVVWVLAASVAFFVILVTMLVGTAFAGMLVGFAGASRGVAAFFGIGALGLFIAAAIASIGMAVMLYLTSAMSFIAVVVENVDPLTAFSQAFRRMFGGGQFWRGFVLALALGAINIGATLVSGGTGALLAYFLHSPALYLIFAGLTSLFFAPFAIVAAAVFYYDVRIRREGYDLQMLVDRFSTPARAPREA